MKLVSIHKLALILLFSLIGFTAAHAQVWTLEQCIDSAQVYNKNLRMAENEISISEQRHKEAKANLMPKITLSADYKYFVDLPYQLMPAQVFGGVEGQFKEAQFGVPHNINASVQVAMPLYNPQVYGALKTTGIASELTQLKQTKTEEQIFFEISNLYFNAQILHHQLDFISSNLANTEKLLVNTELLMAQLLAKGTDVNKVKLQVAQLTTQKASVNSKYQQVLNTLKFVIGIDAAEEFQIEPTINYQAILEYASLTTTDIRLAKVQSRLLSSELSTLNRSRLFPSINLFGTYGTTGYGYDKKPNDFLNFYPISFAGIQFSYPLFNGTATQRKINQKKFELRNSTLQFDLLTEQNNMQVDNAIMQRLIAFQSIDPTTAQIALAETIYDQTLLQQKQGTASLTDILLADTALREAQQLYLTAVVEYLKADLELKKLTGNISTPKN